MSHPGTIYLIHFAEPYQHARHYIGWAKEGRLFIRLDQHRKGSGARLMEVVTEAEIDWWVSRLWRGDRNKERRLKNQGGASRLCPDCGVKPLEGLSA